MENNSYKYLWKIAQYMDSKKIRIIGDNQDLCIIDRWIIAKCQKVQEDYIEFISNNNLDKAKEVLDNFLINDFYKIYREFLNIKINEKNDSVSGNVFAIIFIKILEMYYEFIPEVIDFIYTNLYSYTNRDLFEEDDLSNFDVNNDVLLFGEDIKKIIMDVNKFRSENNISKKKSLNGISLCINKDDAKLFLKSLDDILKIINARSFNVDFSFESSIESITNDNNKIKSKSIK